MLVGGTLVKANSHLVQNSNTFKLYPVDSEVKNSSKRYQLQCFYCGATIGSEKNVVTNHLESVRHKAAGVKKTANLAVQRKTLRKAFKYVRSEDWGQGDEIKGAKVVVIFDGTTTVGEIFAGWTKV